MSGSNTIPPIPLRFDGAENVQRTIDAIVAKVGQLETANRNASTQMGTLRTQADAAGGSFRNVGQIIGQAGYQVQDFAVQVASGQSALTAFVQQGSQLAGIFGPGGIIAGAALAVGAIALQFFRLGESAEDAQKRIDEANRVATRGANLYREAMDQLTASVLRNADAERQRAQARGLAEAVGAAQTSIDADRRRLAEIQARLGALRTEGTADQLAEYRRIHGADAWPDVQNSGARRVRELLGLEQQERALIESIERMQAARRVAVTPDPRADENGPGDWWQARNAWRAAQAATDADELGPIWQSIQGQYRDYVGALSPTGGGGSTRIERDPRQYGPLDGSTASIEQLRRGALQAEVQATARNERDREKREREAMRELERREEANRRTTDRIVDYGANAFADMFDENGKGWEGLMETFEKTAKQTFARIAAEAIIRPIVAPIVEGLGLGALGGGNGGLSGLFGGTVSGTGSTAGGGGLLSASGGGGTGGGFLSNLGGYVSNPIWQPGAGWFASPSAGTAAGLNALGQNVYGPAVPGGGSTLGSLGGVSLGTYGAAIGGGYMAGSMLGQYIAGSSAARQQNSQIGAGAGAAAGAVAGTMILPGIGTVIGGVLGGLAGGAGGGLLGPGKGFSGGDVGVAVDANGYLTIGNMGGKNWDSGAARQQSQQQLDQINAMLRASGVSIGGMGGMQLGYQGYGGSSRVFGPTEMWGAVSGSLTTSNSTLAAALRSPWMQSFEDLSVIAPYAAQNDNLTRALAGGGIRSRDDFNSAAQWITSTYEPMVKLASAGNAWVEALQAQMQVYNQAIAKAQQLGLAETDLIAARDKQRQAALDERNRAVHGAGVALEIDELRATGNTADARRASMLEFNLSSAQRLRQSQEFLTNNGYGEGTDLYASTTSRLMALFATQRQSLAEQMQEQQRAAAKTLQDAVMGIRIGELQVGTPAQQRQAQLLQFDVGAEQQRASLLGTLKTAGYAADSDRSTSLLARLNELLATQRTSLAEQLNGSGSGAARSGSALMQDLLFAGDYGMTDAARYAGGVTVLSKYKRAGDLENYTSTLRNLIPLARDYLGTSERYGTFMSDARRDLARLGGDPDGLLQDAQVRTASGIESLLAETKLQKAEVTALRKEMANIGAVLTTLMARKIA